MRITNVLRRDLCARGILVECPHCLGPLSLQDYAIANLEDGIDTLGACEYCGQMLMLTAPGLGQDVWPDPLA